ncbi:MAG: guanylate kinase [Defluviitaleaceae bacterium]|nr:guanylate kinase [Defluviitaleaceae bacterium]
MQDGLMLIISGPSGSGKGTVVKKLCGIDDFALSISMTTRQPREGELHGKDYIFCTEEEFFATRDSNGFLEHATFSGHYYGTPISYVEEKIAQGMSVVLEIEVVGALQVKNVYPDALLIFLVPPTFEELRSRLKDRGTENDDEIERRIRRAKEEMEELAKYDYLVINDDIDTALEEIRGIVRAEKLKPKRSQSKIDIFFGNNDK